MNKYKKGKKRKGKEKRGKRKKKEKNFKMIRRCFSYLRFHFACRCSYA
jgi:hypothetical protein